MADTDIIKGRATRHGGERLTLRRYLGIIRRGPVSRHPPTQAITYVTGLLEGGDLL